MNAETEMNPEGEDIDLSDLDWADEVKEEKPLEVVRDDAPAKPEKTHQNSNATNERK